MNNIHEYDRPFVCTDAVIFTIETVEPDSYRRLPDTRLKVLLYERDTEPHMGKWCLPGGFLNIDELPEDNIRRKLSAKTRINHCWLEQLYTFCTLNRDSRARVISIAYLGLMNESDATALELGSSASWFTLTGNTGQSPGIANKNITLTHQDFGFDHYNIITTAFERMQSKILYTNIVFNLLPKEFTLTQLQNVYDTILGKKYQAANFRRKIAEIVQETDKYTHDKGHRPAKIYTKK